WFDITEDLEPGSPYTLGKSDDAVGALQFSVAYYKSGDRPKIDCTALKSMLIAFFKNKDLGVPIDMACWSNGICCARGDFKSGTDAHRIWYLSNGQDIAFVTYTTLVSYHSLFDSELKEAEAIVESICFNKGK